MIVEMDEEFRQCCTIDGSVFKYRRGKYCTGTIVRYIGMILTFAAIISYVILAVASAAAGTPSSSGLNVYTTVFLCAGIILTLVGFRMRKKQEKGYDAYYAEKNQVSSQVIHEFDEECKKDGVMLAIPEKTRKRSETQTAGVITAHYLLLPGMYGRLAKISEIAAAFYDSEPKLSGGKVLEAGLVYITTDGLKHLAPLAEPYAKEIVGELSKRNLAMYTKKMYTAADGKTVNNFDEPGPVIENYKRHVR